MFIDTHMHIGDDFGVQPDLYVKNASDAQVEVLIASFCELYTSINSLKLIKIYIIKSKNMQITDTITFFLILLNSIIKIL